MLVDKFKVSYRNHSRAHVYADLAHYESDQALRGVYVVECSVFTKSISGSEQQGTDSLYSNKLETSVVTRTRPLAQLSRT